MVRTSSRRIDSSIGSSSRINGTTTIRHLAQEPTRNRQNMEEKLTCALYRNRRRNKHEDYDQISYDKVHF